MRATSKIGMLGDPASDVRQRVDRTERNVLAIRVSLNYLK